MGELGYEIPTESEITDEEVKGILELYSGVKSRDFQFQMDTDFFYAEKLLKERGFQLKADPRDTQSITFDLAYDSIELKNYGSEGNYRLVLEIDAEKEAWVLNCGGSNYDYSERYEEKEVVDFFLGLISKGEDE